MTTDTQTPGTEAPSRAGRPSAGSMARALLEDRVALLVVLLVVMLGWFFALSAGGYLVAPYDLSYMASALESMVPLAILGLAQLLVIVSGRGGIDLSVGAMVSLVGMVFGFAYGMWEWSFLPALLLALAAGWCWRGQRRPGRLPAGPGPDRHPGHLLRLQLAGPDQQPTPPSRTSHSRT